MLHETLRELDDDAAWGVLHHELDALAIDTVEDLGRDIGNFFQRAGPGMAQGALTGAATGAAAGPWGAVIGGALGAVAGGATSYMATEPHRAPTPSPTPSGSAPRPPPSQPATPPSRPATPPSHPATPPSPPATPPAAPTATQGDPRQLAALQLLALLQRPEVVQSIVSLALGRAGAQSTRVGESVVPSVAVASMLGQLAQRAVEYHHDTVGPPTQTPAYLADSEGHVAPEMAFPEVRADVLLGLFGEAVDAEVDDFDEDDFDEDDFDFDEDDFDFDEEPVEYESAFDDDMSEDRYWEGAW